jgi:nondiscriminating glutamyl-tRNA synthetase
MRTRFAPSPTGFLHVGGLRTALFSFLLAKKHGGTFYLRIEDTDQTREVEGATLNILNTLQWAGLDPEEGVMLRDGRITQEGAFGPYFQSQRLALYGTHVQKLLDAGHAYRCFCSKERLEKMREEQERFRRAPMYDRQCLRLPKEEVDRRAREEPSAVRMLIPRGQEIVCHDHIRGRVTFALDTLDDQVILKSDGFPTYHLAHVIDDHLMQTSLVVRGEEWLPSLPKHLLLFQCLGWQPPEYAHVPLLLAKGGGKLSKRRDDVSVEVLRERGYLPEAVVNFIALLGWNPGTTQEVLSLADLMEQFSLLRVQKAGAIFERGKLDWLQGQWLRRMPLREFAERIRPVVTQQFREAAEDPAFEEKARLIQERIAFFSEAPAMLQYFYEEPTVTLALLVNERQGVRREDLPKIFDVLLITLKSIEPWTEATIQDALFRASEKHNLKHSQLLWPLRAALTGLPYSPGAFEVAETLGRKSTLSRLQAVKDIS